MKKYLCSLQKSSFGYVTFFVLFALGMLAGCSSPIGGAYEQLKSVFAEGVLAQKSGDYDKAISRYKVCIYSCSSDQRLCNDSVKLLLPRTMDNLLNSYLSKSMAVESLAFFDSLRLEMDGNRFRNREFSKTFKRDVCVMLAYAMSETGAEKEAAKMMDMAMQMPLQYSTHERKLRHYMYASLVYNSVPGYLNKELKYGRLVVEEMQKYDHRVNKINERKNVEIIAGITGGLLLLVLIIIYVYERKQIQYRYTNIVGEYTKMQSVLNKVKEEKDKMEDAKVKLEQQLDKIERKEIENVKSGVSLQQLLTMRGDDKFKEYFNRAYPSFIVSLRKQADHITNKEELYCMLLALNTNNEELASIFNVARSSVVVAKYRIRKKLDLIEGKSMEEYLADLLQTS